MGQRTGRQSVYSFAIIFLCPERPSGPGVVVFQAGREGGRKRSLACRGGAEASGQVVAGLVSEGGAGSCQSIQWIKVNERWRIKWTL